MAKPIAYQYKQGGSLNLFLNGKLVTVGKDDLNYEPVAKALKAAQWESVAKMLTVKDAIASYTNGRVEVVDNEIFIDKKALPKAVASRILTLLKQTDFDINPVFRLLENIEANPADYARDELYLFLEGCDLPFTPDGHFLAYKYVNSDYMDVHSGTIRNQVGDTPSMRREDVDPVRDHHCSRGLHFCSKGYLGDGNGRLRLMVLKINPANVVSIPSDYNNTKGRCWTYEVVDELPSFADNIPSDYTEKYTDLKSWYGEQDVSDTSDKDDDDDEDEEDFLIRHRKKPTDTSTVDYSTKLKDDDVRKIRKMLQSDWTLVGIAEQFGISARQVARIRDGESWAEVK
jgi:hypothetical protein